jgi:glycerol-3-phosphate dehydrogenase
VAAGCETLRAEVVHVISHEMAARLTDIVIRRTGLGAAGHPGPDAVRGCAEIAAEVLQWSPDRTRQEIAAVDEFYSIRQP